MTRPSLGWAVRLALLATLLMTTQAPGVAAAEAVVLGRDASANDYRPAVAESPDGQRLVALWVHELSVRTATSTDGGQTWTDALVLAAYEKVYVDDPRVAYDTGGVLHAVWMSGLAGARTVNYAFVPAGADPADAAAWRAGQPLCKPCIEPELALGPDGAVYVSYRDRGGNGQVGIRRVSGAGGRFQAGGRTFPSEGPADLAVTPDGRIHVAYTVGGVVYYGRFQGYDRFKAEVITRVSTTDRANIQPAVAAGPDNHVHLVWVQSTGSNRTVYYRDIAPEGLGEPERVSDSRAAKDDVHQWVDVMVDADGVPRVTWTAFDQIRSGAVHENRRVDGRWLDPANAALTRVVPDGRASRQSSYGLSWARRPLLGFALRAGSTFAASVRALEPGRPPEPPPSLGDACETPPETGRAVCGPFRAYWNARGGVSLFGFPLSDLRWENNPDDGQRYIVQYFERARFEYHPEAGGGNDVLLGLLGRAVTRDRAGEGPFLPVSDPGDGTWFGETGHTLRDGFRAYWERRGGLAVFGFPISEPFPEVNPDDGQTYVVQYFERNRFEYHPELAGTDYEVLLGQLGRQLMR